MHDIPEGEKIRVCSFKNFENAYGTVNPTEDVLKDKAGFGQDAEFHNLSLGLGSGELLI